MRSGILIYVVVVLSLGALQAQPLTYFGDVKEILGRNCISCHNKEGIAPFALENIDQVKAHKGIILSVVEKGIMPPWKPDPNYTHFLSERILSASDKQKIVSWIQQGCQAGEPSSDLARQENKDRKNTPDQLVLRLPFTIKIPANNADTIVLVEMPYEIEQDTFISSYEFVPEHNSGIHHLFVSVEDADKNATKADFEDLPGLQFWDGKAFHERFSYKYPAFAGGWRPGQTVIAMPPKIGWLLPKKGLMLYQIHYGPSPVAVTSQFEMRFTYAKEKIERLPEGQQYGSQNQAEPYPPLVVPPDSIMRFTINGPINFDYSIISMGPHMHLLGKSYKVWLLKPNGDTVRLMYINDWDFNQQEFYYPATLIKAEKGDILQAEVILDNTSGNIRNPNKPPKLVKFGQGTKDEMIQFSIYMVPYKKGDETLSPEINN